MVNKNNNVNYIKQWYKENPNGLLITNRQVGKSSALIEILYDEVIVKGNNVCILSYNYNRVKSFRPQVIKFLQSKYKDISVIDALTKILYNKILTLEQFKRYKKTPYLFSNDDFYNLNPKEGLLIDEYFFHRELVKDFRFAISTMDFPIHIKKFETNSCENFYKKRMGEENFKKEYSCDFSLETKKAEDENELLEWADRWMSSKNKGFKFE